MSRRLLIVTHNDFASGLSAFVAHKVSLGWTVDVANTSTIGTTTTAIRDYIRLRYNNAATRPDAVLLVGDTDRIPYFVGLADDTSGHRSLLRLHGRRRRLAPGNPGGAF